MRRQEYSFSGNCMDLFLLNYFADIVYRLKDVHCLFPKYLIFSIGIVLCSSVTAIVLGVIFSITNTFRPFPDDIFRYGQDMILLLCLPLIHFIFLVKHFFNRGSITKYFAGTEFPCNYDFKTCSVALFHGLWSKLLLQFSVRK